MDPGPDPGAAQRVVGRYVLHGEIAHGGMATVHFGRLVGEVGFSRTVAIKCLHAQFAKDPDFKSMFLDEARLCARIRHPNVVPILDVITLEGELFMVMEYVQGETLSRLVRNARNAGKRIPLRVIAAIMTNALEGLHAAHEAVSELGEPLGIVHRDVSPQNIMIGVDGIARVLDFGVAKAAGRIQSTRDGQLKGKLPYMSPEQLRGSRIDRRTDVYAAAVVLWESLTGRRLFDAEDEVVIFGKVLEGSVEPPSSVVSSLPRALDDVCLKGLQKDPDHRFQSAQEMAIALERAVGLAIPREIGRWVEQTAGASLKKRADRIAEIESVSTSVGAAALAARNSANYTPPPVSQGFVPPGVSPEVISSVSTVSSLTSPSMVTAPAAHQYTPSSMPSQLSQAQLTALAMSRQGDEAPKKSVAIVVAAIIAGVLVAFGLIAVIIVVSRPQGPAAAGSATTAPPTAATTPSAVATQPPSTASAPVATATAEVPAPTATTAKTAAVAPTGTGTGKTAQSKDKTGEGKTSEGKTGGKTTATSDTTAATPPTPKTDCNPPYTLDANGVRIPKPQCL